VSILETSLRAFWVKLDGRGVSMAKHILIVDDEESIAFFLGENLTALGLDYHVEMAGSAEEALGKLATRHFDLVVTDLRLPGMNGLELIGHLRQASPLTRTILITAYGNGHVQAEACRLEVHRSIMKPFPMEQFLQAAQEAIALRRISPK
jgi:DNA-binding NtrC family response regulator